MKASSVTQRSRQAFAARNRSGIVQRTAVATRGLTRVNIPATMRSAVLAE
jgi:hypothetical protein